MFSRRALLVQGLLCGSGLTLTAVILGQTDPESISAIWRGMGDVALWQWAIAMACTIISYGAIGRYDRALHGWLGTGVDPRAAEATGRAAIAVSQMTGMGLVTGTLTRWYLLPDLTLARAAGVTAAVGGSFLAGFFVLGAAFGLMTGILPGYLVAPALALVGAAALVTVASLAAPGHSWARHLPPLRRLGTVLGLVLIDMAAAATAFAVLLGAISPQILAAAFLSLGAGLLGATPAGIGGFEGAMTLLLPTVAPDALMAAALCFHLVYFALPALVAVLAIALRRKAWIALSHTRPSLEARDASGLRTGAERARRAEVGLISQPGALALTTPGQGLRACVQRSRQSLISVAAADRAPLAELKTLAKAEGRTALAYKITPEDAVAARRLGWSVRRTGTEAWLNPAAFSTDGSARRQLRRKIRQAEKAGLVGAEIGAVEHLADLSRIDTTWQARRGPARGCSMGRFHPESLERQRIFGAWVDGRLVAFASFHATPHEWVLDLVRSTNDAPDGTMHLIVTQAIQAAASESVPRLSLAAVPEQDLPIGQDLFDRLTGRKGLKQFKASFAPNWSPRYAAAPSGLSLLLGLAEIAREIRRPA